MEKKGNEKKGNEEKEDIKIIGKKYINCVNYLTSISENTDKDTIKKLRSIYKDIERYQFYIFNFIQQKDGKPIKSKFKSSRGPYNKKKKNEIVDLKYEIENNENNENFETSNVIDYSNKKITHVIMRPIET